MRLLNVCVTLLAAQMAYCQTPIPVLKANSTKIDIQDGTNLRAGYWTASPDVERDTYYAQRSEREKDVTFKSDVDSISFHVKPGQTYDFVVLLHGKRCNTRISAVRETYRTAGPRPSKIPFTMSSDGKIHLPARINGSEPLDLMFDTGADTTVLFKSAIDKGVKVSFDGMIENSGFGGTSHRNTSSDNRLDLAQLHWGHESILYIEKQADKADGIVGFNVFEDKVIAIDYDAGIITVYDSLPAKLPNYAKLPLKWQGATPMIQATVYTGQSSSTGWFVLDTGSNASLHLASSFAKTNNLYGTMKTLGSSRSGGVGAQVIENEVDLLPRLEIGNTFFGNLPIDVEERSSGGTASHIGMEVLKRFNTVLDFQGNAMYIQPNHLMGQPFVYRSAAWYKVAGGVIVLLLAAVVVWWRRKTIGSRSTEVR